MLDLLPPPIYEQATSKADEFHHTRFMLDLLPQPLVTFVINKLLESLITRVTGSSRAVRSTLEHGFSEMDE
jgi:hypothetical protein